MLAGTVQWTTASGGNGHYYEVISAPGGITWGAASGAATADGGYLATITSAAENNFVFGLADNISDYVDVNGGDRALGPWLGAYRTGSSPSDFAWVTGEPFAYTDWAAGEPSNTGGDENNIQYIGKCPSGSGSCALAATWTIFPAARIPITANFQLAMSWNSMPTLLLSLHRGRLQS